MRRGDAVRRAGVVQPRSVVGTKVVLKLAARFQFECQRPRAIVSTLHTINAFVTLVEPAYQIQAAITVNNRGHRECHPHFAILAFCVLLHCDHRTSSYLHYTAKICFTCQEEPFSTDHLSRCGQHFDQPDDSQTDQNQQAEQNQPH
jgi:hypothetical protein